MSEYRIEKDSMGEVKVPASAYYGAQTQRRRSTTSQSLASRCPRRLHPTPWAW